MDGFLSALAANKVVNITTTADRHFIELGSSVITDNISAADQQQATEAIKAIDVLGEDRAMSYLEEVVDAPTVFV